MNKEQITIEGLTLERISKTEAMHRYNRGKETHCCPLNNEISEVRWVIIPEPTTTFNDVIMYFKKEMHYKQGAYIKFYKPIQ